MKFPTAGVCTLKKLLFCFDEMEIFHLEGEYSQPVADPKCIFPRT